jgi:hypothetical protein
MTFSNFAGSLLLVLTLASLSALAPATPRPGQSLPYQSVATHAAAAAVTADTRLAMADARVPERVPAATAATGTGATVPNAGQIVPETGQ